MNKLEVETALKEKEYEILASFVDVLIARSATAPSAPYPESITRLGKIEIRPQGDDEKAVYAGEHLLFEGRPETETHKAKIYVYSRPMSYMGFPQHQAVEFCEFLDKRYEGLDGDFRIRNESLAGIASKLGIY